MLCRGILSVESELIPMISLQVFVLCLFGRGSKDFTPTKCFVGLAYLYNYYNYSRILLLCLDSLKSIVA